tara:strand:+ start:417 stop:761 length:345 start_codon:yes stop_codon:yes gene_type:complete
MSGIREDEESSISFLLTFKEAYAIAKERGKAIRRLSHSTDIQFLYIQKQVTLSGGFIPKMTSVPDDIKTLLIFNDSDLKFVNRGLLSVSRNNEIDNYEATEDDKNANDWGVVKS